MERLQDPQLTLAIVGNGPSDLGKGFGAEIDGRDEVIRFNRLHWDSAKDPDYGSKTTIVISVNPVCDAWRAYKSLSPGTIVGFVTEKRAFLERDWNLIAELEAGGVRVCFPFRTTREIVGRSLGLYPSTGLMLLAEVKRMRPSLSPQDAFGFSFGEDERGRYSYHDPAAKPFERHEWQAERVVFEKLFAS